MPTGKVEKYRVVLMLDRLQRKLLDRLEGACSFAVHHAAKHALQRLEDTKMVTPLDEFERIVDEFLKEANPPFFDETKKAIAMRACDVYTNIVAGEIDGRARRPHALLLAVPADQVLFSTSGRQVRLPYLGLANYQGNQKAVPYEQNGDVYVPKKSYTATLGFHNQEPCLMLNVVPPKKVESGDFGGQKLTKLTASEIARRRTGAKKNGSRSPEPK